MFEHSFPVHFKNQQTRFLIVQTSAIWHGHVYHNMQLGIVPLGYWQSAIENPTSVVAAVCQNAVAPRDSILCVSISVVG
jgi:hypothetical protein